jgi:hypothetical protein
MLLAMLSDAFDQFFNPALAVASSVLTSTRPTRHLLGRIKLSKPRLNLLP